MREEMIHQGNLIIVSMVMIMMFIHIPLNLSPLQWEKSADRGLMAKHKNTLNY